jgi:sialate O-acetylesterase
MIQCTWEDSPGQAWISNGGLSRTPSIIPFQSGGDARLNDRKDGSRISSGIFNGMISPLIPFAISGVIWYQGESDDGSNALQYRRMLPRLITDWRGNWKQGPFPFYFVSLAGFGDDQDAVVEKYRGNDGKPLRSWPWIREGESCALMLPNTGMAMAYDIGDPDTRIPEDKLDVGRRLALLARRRVYEENLVDSGPIFQEMKSEGSKIRIRFGSVGGGLIMGIPPWHPEGREPLFAPSLRGFVIRGEDQKWHPADAVIDGDCVILSNDAVRSPVAVRYGWKGLPDGNLYNKNGLPAVPFRTDTDQPE